MSGKSNDHQFEFYDHESPYGTEFRRLLHSINNALSGIDAKTILVTSAMLAEGKSTIAGFLAVTAARYKKKKTLLVDCDLRRPTLHKIFSTPRENGIVEVLTEGRRVRDVVRHTAEPFLDLLTAGKPVPQPTDIFDAAAIHKLLEEVRFYYDLILVDCAPILPVSDPMLLAPEMDGVIMVVKVGATQRDVVLRAAQLLKNNNGRFLGVVLNNVNNALPYFYNDSYYGYEYKPHTKG